MHRLAGTRFIMSVGLVLGALGAAAPAGAQQFFPLGSVQDPPDTGNIAWSVGEALSPDGSIAVGRSTTSTWVAFRWSQATGMENLNSGWPFTVPHQFIAYDCSADGTIVVGQLGFSTGQTYIWTPSGPITLPFQGSFDEISGISHDGTRYCGQVNDQIWDYSASQGLRYHDGPPGWTTVNLEEMSGDGLHYVGTVTYTGNVLRAALFDGGTSTWTDLGVLPGGSASFGRGVSTDGSVVAGYSFVGGTTQPFRWTAGGGMVALSPALGGDQGRALCVSGDGQFVGGTRSTTGTFDNARRMVLWRADGTIRDVEADLIATGVDLSGLRLHEVAAISADGNTILVNGDGPNQFGQPGGPDRAFVISGLLDGTAPTITISSPVPSPAAPAPYPQSEYLYGEYVLDPAAQDMPIPVVFTADDLNGVASTTVLVDGVDVTDTTVYDPRDAEETSNSVLPADRALTINGTAYNFSPDYAPSFQELPNGLAVLNAQVYAQGDFDDIWRLELWFDQIPMPASPRLEMNLTYSPGSQQDPADWRYYALDSSESYMFGLADNNLIDVSLSPLTDGQLQVGYAANGRNIRFGASAIVGLSSGLSGTMSVNFELWDARRALTSQLFYRSGLGALGTHTIEITAADASGNSTTVSNPFEVVLTADWGLLYIDPADVNGTGPVVPAVLQLPYAPAFNPFDPIQDDVVFSTIQLEAVANGATATPFFVTFDDGVLLMLFDRTDLLGTGADIGRVFRLTGRFNDASTGPSFIGNYDLDAE